MKKKRPWAQFMSRTEHIGVDEEKKKIRKRRRKEGRGRVPKHGHCAGGAPGI